MPFNMIGSYKITYNKLKNAKSANDSAMKEEMAKGVLIMPAFKIIGGTPVPAISFQIPNLSIQLKKKILTSVPNPQMNFSYDKKIPNLKTFIPKIKKEHPSIAFKLSQLTTNVDILKNKSDIHIENEINILNDLKLEIQRKKKSMNDSIKKFKNTPINIPEFPEDNLNLALISKPEFNIDILINLEKSIDSIKPKIENLKSLKSMNENINLNININDPNLKLQEPKLVAVKRAISDGAANFHVLPTQALTINLTEPYLNLTTNIGEQLKDSLISFQAMKITSKNLSQSLQAGFI